MSRLRDGGQDPVAVSGRPTRYLEVPCGPDPRPQPGPPEPTAAPFGSAVESLENPTSTRLEGGGLIVFRPNCPIAAAIVAR